MGKKDDNGINDQLDITIKPALDPDHHATVFVQFGSEKTKMSLMAARELASRLNRAASDAAYEAAIATMMKSSGFTVQQIHEAIQTCRAVIEQRHIKQN